MSALSSWRTALRIARREARRAKGRSSLVVVMIALPVLFLTFAAVSYDMFELTGSERADQIMGRADARVIWPSKDVIEQDTTGETYWQVRVEPKESQPNSGEPEPANPAIPTESELLTKLPAGTSVLSLRKGSAALTTATGTGDVGVVAIDATNPMTDGYVRVLEGRAPRAPNEVALTEQAALRLGANLGGTVTSADGKRAYTVVGRVEFPSALEEIVLFAPITDAAPAGFSLGQVWLVDTPQPVTWRHVRQLNESGIAVASREVFLNPPPADQVPNMYQAEISTQDLAIGVLVAGVALLEIVLLAGPAFAVSARRRQRQLALVAANGGTPSHIRRIVLADGVVLGAAGAGVGVIAGIATAFIARPFIEDLVTHTRAGGYRIYPVALVAISCLAVGTGLLAALVPAFMTARQHVVSALAGRRGVVRSKRRWIMLGLVMIAAGAAVVIAGTLTSSAQIILAGLVAGELGMVLCTPALVGLIAKAGRILPVAPRIALRDAARNRAAAAPAISAVMAAVAGSVAIGLYVDSAWGAQNNEFKPSAPVGTVTASIDSRDPKAASPAVVESALRATLPVREVRNVSWVACVPDPSTPQGPANQDTWCGIEPQFAPDHLCPFRQTAMTGQPVLSTQQQREARADPRCRMSQIYGSGSGVVVDDGSAVAALTGASVDDVAAARAVLGAGGIVVRDARYIQDGKVTVKVMEAGRDGMTERRQLTLPGHLLTTGAGGAAPIISPAAVRQAGLDAVPGTLIASTTREPTQAEVDRMNRQLEAVGVYANVERERPFELPLEVWILTGAAALITLGAAGIGTGLAAADGRADLSTLASVGASPRMRRGLSISQSGVIAGLGSVLGAGAGLGAGIAVLMAMNLRWANVWPGPDPLPINVPWLSLVTALLVVPAIAILGAGLLTRSRLPIERRL